MKKIESCVEITKNISKNWSSRDYEFKTKLQKLMFPEGIVIEPEIRQYRTTKVNQVFSLTSSISRDNEQKEKNPSTKIVNGSCLVAGAGLVFCIFNHFLTVLTGLQRGLNLVSTTILTQI